MQFNIPAEMDLCYVVQLQCCLSSQHKISCLLTEMAFVGMLLLGGGRGGRVCGTCNMYSSTVQDICILYSYSQQTVPVEIF